MYCIGFKRCHQQYIGESERSLKERFSELCGYVSDKNLTKATGDHFNQTGHNISDMTVKIIDNVHSTDELFRKEREKSFIKKMNSRYEGINGKS